MFRIWATLFIQLSLVLTQGHLVRYRISPVSWTKRLNKNTAFTAAPVQTCEGEVANGRWPRWQISPPMSIRSFVGSSAVLLAPLPSGWALSAERDTRGLGFALFYLAEQVAALPALHWAYWRSGQPWQVSIQLAGSVFSPPMAKSRSRNQEVSEHARSWKAGPTWDHSTYQSSSHVCHVIAVLFARAMVIWKQHGSDDPADPLFHRHWEFPPHPAGTTSSWNMERRRGRRMWEHCSCHLAKRCNTKDSRKNHTMDTHTHTLAVILRPEAGVMWRWGWLGSGWTLNLKQLSRIEKEGHSRPSTIAAPPETNAWMPWLWTHTHSQESTYGSDYSPEEHWVALIWKSLGY